MFYIFIFLGLSLRKIVDILSSCFIKMKSCLSMELVSEILIKKLFSTKRRIEEFIVDETLIKVGTDLIWLWILLIR